MKLSSSRLFSLIALGLVIFAIAAFLVVQLMPKPMRQVDYLIAGGVATLISLLTMWVLLMKEIGGEKDMLFKKRRRNNSSETERAKGGEI